MKGDEKAWKKMIKYGEHDVTLLRELYLRIRPWMTTHPNFNLFTNSYDSLCPKCGSSDIRWRGERHTQTMSYHRFSCNDCGGWGTARQSYLDKEKRKSLVRSA